MSSGIRRPVVAHGFPESSLNAAERYLRDAFLNNCYPAQNGYAQLSQTLKYDASVIKEWFADQRKLCSQMIKSGQRSELPESVTSKIRMNQPADTLFTRFDSEAEQRLTKVWERNPFPTAESISDWAALMGWPVEQVQAWLDRKRRDADIRQAPGASYGAPPRTVQHPTVGPESLPTPTATVSPQAFASSPLHDDIPVKVEFSRGSPFATIKQSPRVTYSPSLYADSERPSPLQERGGAYASTALRQIFPPDGVPGPGPSTLSRWVASERSYDRGLSQASTSVADPTGTPQRKIAPSTHDPVPISPADVKPPIFAMETIRETPVRRSSTARPLVIEWPLFSQFLEHCKEAPDDFKPPTTLEEVLQFTKELGERSQRVYNGWITGQLQGIGLHPPDRDGQGTLPT